MATDEPRCPYCVEGDEFKLMTQTGSVFVCQRCGHLVSLSDPNFFCDCWQCRRLRTPTQSRKVC